MATVDKIKQFLLDILFPRFCLGCGIEGTYLCDDCKATLDISENQYCLCDKNTLRLPPNEKVKKCKRCNQKKLSGLYFSLSYKEKPLTRKLIHFFKYPPFYAKDLARTLASLLIDHLLLLEENPKLFFKDSVLIPVPLDKKKHKRRGYNQAEELAKEISIFLETPLLADNLFKTKTTLSQMELPEKERRENLKNAFSCREPEKIKNKKVFLVDDVYTTGSTMEECARVLKQAGAKEVWGIAIARD
jgi:ComF family protein